MVYESTTPDGLKDKVAVPREGECQRRSVVSVCVAVLSYLRTDVCRNHKERGRDERGNCRVTRFYRKVKERTDIETEISRCYLMPC